MTKPIDKGRSVLNATDEAANPYGLILSEAERNFIYGQLNYLETMTNALLYGKTGWKQQAQATLSAVTELSGVVLAVAALHYLLEVPTVPMFVIGFALVVLQKLNLLLTHENMEDTDSRRNRERDKDAKERAKYFKDMGCKDMSLEA
jgi:hypothetical protein